SSHIRPLTPRHPRLARAAAPRGAAARRASRISCGASGSKAIVPPCRTNTDGRHLSPFRRSSVGTTPRRRTASVGGSETILVVEDEESVRELGRNVLQRFGDHVLLAATPQEAVAIAERHSPIDLLVSDVVLPQINGPALARQIAGAARCAHIDPMLPIAS